MGVHFVYCKSCKDAHTGIQTDKALDQHRDIQADTATDKHRDIQTEAFTGTQDLTT